MSFEPESQEAGQARPIGRPLAPGRRGAAKCGAERKSEAQRSLSEIIDLLDRIEFQQGLWELSDADARCRREQALALFALARRGLYEVSRTLNVHSAAG
ncbi:MAG TPA: hypothetical protein VGC92_11340 [Phenylobacterium sp.]